MPGGEGGGREVSIPGEGGGGGGGAAARLAAMVPKTVGKRAPAAAWDAAAMRVQTVFGSPRVRLVHTIVTLTLTLTLTPTLTLTLALTLTYHP